MRLIDADALFKAFENAAWYNNADRDDVAEELLLDAPTIDTEPVVHGRWYWAEDRHCKCSVCGQYATVKRTAVKTNYCPNCGAKMRGGEDE